MEAYIDFCRSMWVLLIAAIDVIFEAAKFVVSNPELRQWICDSIADSPVPVFLLLLMILVASGWYDPAQHELRKIWRAADTFCTARDISRWFRQK